MSNLTLFDKFEEPECAYMIKNGSINLEFTDEGAEDTVKVSGKKKIIGAGTLLLTNADGFTHYRPYRAVSNGNTNYIPIEPKKLNELIMEFNAGFSITKDLSELLNSTSAIQVEKNKKIGKREKLSREYCKVFATTINKIRDIYGEKKFPWLEKLAEKYINSTTYEKGKSFTTFDFENKHNFISRELDEFNIEYVPGSTICNQGDKGTDMYILISGKIEVLVSGNRVAVIDSPGEFLGETALLLGQERSATLKTLTETVLTVIRKKDLKKVWQAKPDFLKNVAISLARRIEKTSSMINELDETLKKQRDESEIDKINNHYAEELNNLKSDLWDLKEKVEMDWICDLFLDLSRTMRELRAKYK